MTQIEHRTETAASLSRKDYLSLTAPMTLAFTGVLYLSGFYYRQTLLEGFGLGGRVLDEPVQDTLAGGYIPLVSLVIVISLAAAAGALTGHLAPAAIEKAVPSGALARRIGKVAIATYFLIATLFIGAMAGAALAQMKLADIRQTVARGCHEGCFVYQLKQGRFVGALIGQDHDRLLAYTAGGVRIVDNADLLTVSAYRP